MQNQKSRKKPVIQRRHSREAQVHVLREPEKTTYQESGGSPQLPFLGGPGGVRGGPRGFLAFLKKVRIFHFFWVWKALSKKSREK